MIEQFNKYVLNYDFNNPKIKLKYDHSFRVMQLSHEYSIKLNFSNEDIYLAELIGLLHDIGRFEQLKVYDTYDDNNSIDHADYSVRELFDKNGIREFISDNSNDNIIKLAIKNHNKLTITGVNDDRTLMHCKLIRDVDKIDILYNIAYLNEIKINDKDVQINPLVLEDIKNHRSVNIKNVENKNDFICCWMAFAFDIYNDICLEKVKKYLEVIYSRLNYPERFKDVYEEINNYIEKRMN